MKAHTSNVLKCIFPHTYISSDYKSKLMKLPAPSVSGRIQRRLARIPFQTVRERRKKTDERTGKNGNISRGTMNLPKRGSRNNDVMIGTGQSQICITVLMSNAGVYLSLGMRQR